jgi:hypothetical protein
VTLLYIIEAGVQEFQRPFFGDRRARDGPVGCQVRELSVQDRGSFRRFIGPRRPDAGRFGLSGKCRREGRRLRELNQRGRRGLGPGRFESVESPGRCSGRCPGGPGEMGDDLGTHGLRSRAMLMRASRRGRGHLAVVRRIGMSVLWGFCRTCYYADVCRAGCTWTSHVLFGRPGNNPYCHYRALELSKRGLRERVIKVEDAPGRPFDHGRFELVLEPLDGGEGPRVIAAPPPQRAPSERIHRSEGRVPTVLRLCHGCRQYVLPDAPACPHCGGDVAGWPHVTQSPSPRLVQPRTGCDGCSNRGRTRLSPDSNPARRASVGSTHRFQRGTRGRGVAPPLASRETHSKPCSLRIGALP